MGLFRRNAEIVLIIAVVSNIVDMTVSWNLKANPFDFGFGRTNATNKVNNKNNYTLNKDDTSARRQYNRPTSSYDKVDPDDFIRPKYNNDGYDSWDQFWKTLNDIQDKRQAHDSPHWKYERIWRMCYLAATTLTGALKDLRDHFKYRYFYENTLEYEVGYLASEVTLKYRRMLEIFYIAQTKYETMPEGRLAIPPSGMVYLYTNVLEMGSIVSHLCNMMHELEKKYKTMEASGFSDYHLQPQERGTGQGGPGKGGKKPTQEEIDRYNERMEKERKRRERQRNKLLKKNLYIGFSPTPPDRVHPKKKSNWNFHYGWSIEYWQ